MKGQSKIAAFIIEKLKTMVILELNLYIQYIYFELRKDYIYDVPNIENNAILETQTLKLWQ
jgi:hypothetical protein